MIGRVLFDAARASLDCAAFSDSAIHALELRRVFAPSWLFVAPANRSLRVFTPTWTGMASTFVMKS